MTRSTKRNTNQQIGKCWQKKKFQRPELQLALKGKWAWLANQEDKKEEAHQAAMSKKAPACFAKSSGHVFNHPKREIDFKESVLGEQK